MNSMDKMVDQKKLQSPDCPFRRFFLRQPEQDDSTDSEKIHTKYMRSSSDISLLREERASTSGVYNEVVSGEEFVRDNGSLLSLQPWVFKRAKCSKMEEDADASVCWSFDWGFSHGSPRRINPSSNWIGSKRRQDRYNFRPITSVENIFMPHICREEDAVEECTFNFHPPSRVEGERIPCLMPSSRETSRKKLDSLVEQPENRQAIEIGPGMSSEKEVSFDQVGGSVDEELTTVVGVPHLPPRKLRKEERKSRGAMPTSLDTSSSQKLCKISDALGLFDGMLLFVLGIAVGVTSSVISNKTEVERLKKLLKDNKNLVEDLHEELEMKDSLTVKELGNETGGDKEREHYNLDKSIDAFQNSKWDAAALQMDDRMAKVGANPKALSEIEAELEAELERLEKNINASGIGQMTSDFIELQLDSELVADVAHGEFREDLFINGGGECPADDENDKDASTGGTPHPYNSNYSVSPKELTIRLHRVIESRLEERVKELESELEQSRLKLKLVVGSERSSSKPPFSSSSDAGSSNQDSSESSKRDGSSPRLNLSGDALIAYDEVYEEFIRLAVTEDEKLPSSVSAGDNKKDQAWEQVMWRTGSYGSGTEEEEEEEDDDSFDEGRDLIQKIVEKTKQGSPALLNAQRMFFLMDL